MDIRSSDQTLDDVSTSPTVADLNPRNSLDFTALKRLGTRGGAGKSFYAVRMKRAFDVAAAAVALILAFPLVFLIAIVILCVDGLPIIFFQERIGQDLQPFRMLKFRTMRRSAERMLDDWRATSDPLWQEYVSGNFKIANDPRILPFGSFLRRYSLDELPQLWNVLHGEMSMVGPRPLPLIQHQEELSEAARDAIRIRARVRPGITGSWQVSGRSTTTFEELLDHDVRYSEQVLFSTDVEILFKTVGAVLSGDGAV